MDELKELGLSNNEIITYVNSLKLGESTANTISSISGLKRSTTYDNLQLLINKGIMSSVSKNNVYYYIPANPEKLVQILTDKVNKVKSIVPELNKLASSTVIKGGVTYYQGKKGVVTVLNDVLEHTNKQFYYIGSRKMAKIPLKHYPDNFVRRRVESNIKVVGILAEEDKQDSFVKEAKAEKLSTFTYDKQLNGTSAISFLYGDKVAFITNVEDPVGVIIDNKEISEFLKNRLF